MRKKKITTKMSAATTPIQISISDAELLELRRCYRCNCATYPICTWLGEPCEYCYCACNFCHLDPDPASPGLFKPATSSTPKNPPRFMRSMTIREVSTDGNGDCLYECISKALNRYVNTSIATDPISVSALRNFVSRKQTNENFEAYKHTARASSNYDCLSRVHTLRGFKNIMQQCGSDVGPDSCLWGDENTLDVVSSAFCLNFVVFDEKGRLVQFIESPESPAHTILLRHYRHNDGEEHFTLLEFNEQTVLQKHEWTWLKKKLGVRLGQ